LTVARPGCRPTRAYHWHAQPLLPSPRTGPRRAQADRTVQGTGLRQRRPRWCSLRAAEKVDADSDGAAWPSPSSAPAFTWPVPTVIVQASPEFCCQGRQPFRSVVLAKVDGDAACATLRLEQVRCIRSFCTFQAETDDCATGHAAADPTGAGVAFPEAQRQQSWVARCLPLMVAGDRPRADQRARRQIADAHRATRQKRPG